MNHERRGTMNARQLGDAIKKGIERYFPGSGFEINVKKKKMGNVDWLIDMILPDGVSYSISVVVKNHLRPSTVALIDSRFQGVDTSFKLVLSDYINPSIAEMLKEQGTWFMDTAGNAYVEIPGKTYIWVTGKKNKEIKSKTQSMISETNARIFFFLLNNGPRIKASYREMAERSGVSLGKVSQTLAELKRMEFLRSRDKNIYITQPGKLLELWVQSYLDKLKPAVDRGIYTWPHGEDFTALKDIPQPLNEMMVIGGERAAELYTGHLKSLHIDLWVPGKDIETFKRQLKLMPSKRGRIRLFTGFADDIANTEFQPKDENLRLANPLIVYADLLETPDSRLQETAEILKRKYLEWIK